MIKWTVRHSTSIHPFEHPENLLDTKLISGPEAIHYYDSSCNDIVSQKGNQFSYRIGKFRGTFKGPLRLKLVPFQFNRLGRRLARIDKGTCLPIPESDRLFVFYQGHSYLYDMAEKRLIETGQFDFRNPLHGGVSVTPQGIYFGEYFFNKQGREVKVFRSQDCGQSWQTAFTFPPNSIWHIHGVIQDPHQTDRFWIHTGDFDGQCKLLTTDDDFQTVTECGGSDQHWRAASLMFTSDSLVWGMDSPERQAHLIRFDRKSGKIEIGQKLPGPVWFSRNLDDGLAVLQTSVEWYGKLAGTESNNAKIFVSRDMDLWTEVNQYKKDAFNPKLFRHGVIHFSQGPQSSQGFTIHGDSLVGFDGLSYLASLKDDNEN